MLTVPAPVCCCCCCRLPLFILLTPEKLLLVLLTLLLLRLIMLLLGRLLSLPDSSDLLLFCLLTRSISCRSLMRLKGLLLLLAEQPVGLQPSLSLQQEVLLWSVLLLLLLKATSRDLLGSHFDSMDCARLQGGRVRPMISNDAAISAHRHCTRGTRRLAVPTNSCGMRFSTALYVAVGCGISNCSLKLGSTMSCVSLYSSSPVTDRNSWRRLRKQLGPPPIAVRTDTL